MSFWGIIPRFIHIVENVIEVDLLRIAEVAGKTGVPVARGPVSSPASNSSCELNFLFKESTLETQSHQRFPSNDLLLGFHVDLPGQDHGLQPRSQGDHEVRRVADYPDVQERAKDQRHSPGHIKVLIVVLGELVFLRKVQKGGFGHFQLFLECFAVGVFRV
ncbi:hypothetical protein HWI79_1195 [Cryptosporidium felis]|nr:hypothetical protein HWI79_1195 [Cryptosporidium felis]